MTILKAIQLLERIVLVKECQNTTAKDIREAGRCETLRYYHWLRKNAPMTSIGLPTFDDYDK